MQKTIGVVCLVAGVLLLVWGYQTGESLKGVVHRLTTSSLHNRTTWMYVGGAVLCTVGLFQIYGGGGGKK